MLSSEGGYHGALDHIAVQGWTDTPNFTVEIGGAPVHLRTEFDAVVDGTDGDTSLQPVTAHFLNSTVVAAGKVEGIPGREGKLISTSGECPSGPHTGSRAVSREEWQIADDGGRLESLFELPPGKKDVVDKLYLSPCRLRFCARFY